MRTPTAHSHEASPVQSAPRTARPDSGGNRRAGSRRSVTARGRAAGLAMMWVVFIFAAIATGAPALPESPAGVPEIRQAVEKSLLFLEKDGLAWETTKCVSCHHGPWMMWSGYEAKKRGFAVNDASLEKVRATMLKAYDTHPKMQPTSRDVMHDLSINVIYLILGMGAAGEPEAPGTQVPARQSAQRHAPIARAAHRAQPAPREDGRCPGACRAIAGIAERRRRLEPGEEAPRGFARHRPGARGAVRDRPYGRSAVRRQGAGLSGQDSETGRIVVRHLACARGAKVLQLHGDCLGHARVGENFAGRQGCRRG